MAPEAASALRDELLGGLCHSLNGRLGAIYGMLHLARLNGADAAEASAELQPELQEIEHIVEQLRWLRGPLDSSAEPLSPLIVMAEACELLHHRASAAPVPAISAPADLPPVRAQWTALRHALLECAAEQAADEPIRFTAADRVVTIAFTMEAGRAAALRDRLVAADFDATVDGNNLQLRLPALG